MIAALLALLPLLFIARARVVRSDRTRIHLIQDMDNQPKFKAQSSNPLFADRRAMRPRVLGTVAREQLNEDTRLYLGMSNGEFVPTNPLPITEALLKRGQERYDIFCAACHGLAGYGDGMVAIRADELQEGTWTPPTSYHNDLMREREDGHLFNTITNGIRNMAAYGPQIPAQDRWAIVAYIRALQRSQNAKLEDVPEELRASLR
ncbi:MAG: cytochrome c [Candidatus Omnitrophota bacterium]|nr:MAG: cytochrome c [Candidatus Omnitrophota bacterium]